MPKPKTTISELERLLARQNKRLEALRKRRDRLVSLLGRLDEQIASLIGKAAAPRRVRRRRKGVKSLEQHVVDVLGQSPQPKTVAEIAEGVIQAGYQSSSKDFVSLVRQVCYRSGMILTKERGKFGLKTESDSPRRGRKTRKAARK